MLPDQLASGWGYHTGASYKVKYWFLFSQMSYFALTMSKTEAITRPQTTFRWSFPTYCTNLLTDLLQSVCGHWGAKDWTSNLSLKNPFYIIYGNTIRICNKIVLSSKSKYFLVTGNSGIHKHWLCLRHLVQQILSHRLLLHFQRYAVSGIVALHVIELSLVGGHTHHPLLPVQDKAAESQAWQEEFSPPPKIKLNQNTGSSFQTIMNAPSPKTCLYMFDIKLTQNHWLKWSKIRGNKYAIVCQ